MKSTITIGTILLEVKPYRTERDGEPPRYQVTGETRTSWTANPISMDGRVVFFSEVKIDKATMLERGNSERKARYVTPEEWEYSKRRGLAESKVRDAVSGWSWQRGLTDAQLDAIASILGVEGYTPLVKCGTESA